LPDSANILVIDDEAITLKMTKAGLERLGFKVAIFSKPDEAISYFSKHHSLIKLVITDKNMPLISGVEILKTFKEINPSIPVLILTGFIEIDEDEELKRMGSRKNLLKPISLKELAKEINEILQVKV